MSQVFFFQVMKIRNFCKICKNFNFLAMAENIYRSTRTVTVRNCISGASLRTEQKLSTCDVTLVWFPDYIPLWIETCSNIQCDIVM